MGDENQGERNFCTRGGKLEGQILKGAKIEGRRNLKLPRYHVKSKICTVPGLGPPEVDPFFSVSFCSISSKFCLYPAFVGSSSSA